MTKRSDERNFNATVKAALREYIEAELAKAPSDEVLEKMYPRSDEMLERILRTEKKKKRTFSYTVYAGLKRVALAVLVCAVVFCEIFIARGGAVASGSDSSIEWYSGYAEICFGSNEESDETFTLSDPHAGYIPMGFELIYYEDRSDFIRLIYSDNDGAEISITAEPSDGVPFTVTADGAEYKKMAVNGYVAHYFYYYGENKICIFYGDEKVTVKLECLNIDKSEVFKIVENIKI